MIKPGTSKLQAILEMLRDVPRRVESRESTIMYCFTIKDTEQVHEALLGLRVDAAIYHGQMGGAARAAAHKLVEKHITKQNFFICIIYVYTFYM